MQSEAAETVDLTQESAPARAAYGVDQQPTAQFVRNCLIARRLDERGVRRALDADGGQFKETRDAHESVERHRGQHEGETDQPIAALLTDHTRRGLLESTLVVWGGEFCFEAVKN
jgi:hypothetical protein